MSKDSVKHNELVEMARKAALHDSWMNPMVAKQTLYWKLAEALSRYNGGRTEGLEEAAKVCDAQAALSYAAKDTHSAAVAKVLADKIRALQSHPIQGDWVMVPREPSEAMIREHERVCWEDGYCWGTAKQAREAYKAMLAASTPTQQQDDDNDKA